MWEEYAMSGVDESSDSHWRWQWQRGRYSGWQLGTDDVQSDDKFDMLASDRYVDIEQAVFLLECLIQEKDDSLKDKAILGLFISFVLPRSDSGPISDAGGGGYRHPCIVMPLALLVAVQ